MPFGYRKPQDLPTTLPVFPLAGALLFPRSSLPLNIFEPRYLNMVDDAIRGDRMIGMIQPAAHALQSVTPELAGIGCVGRISSFTETDDGRYLVTLTGVSRFRVVEELSVATPYRQVTARFEEYARDLSDPSPVFEIDRLDLTKALRRYADAKGFQVDWSAVETAPPEPLVNAIAALCPFDPVEKQALLEAEDLSDRCATLVALLELNAANEDGDTHLQ